MAETHVVYDERGVFVSQDPCPECGDTSEDCPMPASAFCPFDLPAAAEGSQHGWTSDDGSPVLRFPGAGWAAGGTQ